jgi:hypothetical protein
MVLPFLFEGFLSSVRYPLDMKPGLLRVSLVVRLLTFMPLERHFLKLCHNECLLGILLCMIHVQM